VPTPKNFCDKYAFKIYGEFCSSFLMLCSDSISAETNMIKIYGEFCDSFVMLCSDSIPAETNMIKIYTNFVIHL
jgi:hypothetical protein